MDFNEKITTHFTWHELCWSEEAGRHSVPVGKVRDNLIELAKFLEHLRTDVFKSPIIVSSGYRDKEVNELVGGEQGSYHTRGLAADINVKGWKPSAVQAKLSRHHGGLGRYAGFTHVDLRGYVSRWRG